MARCLNCYRNCPGLCCSFDCYDERMSLLLEGVKLLDELTKLVDGAAAARGIRPPGLVAAPAPESVPRRAASASARPAPQPDDAQPSMFAPDSEPLASAAEPPNGLDPPGKAA